MEQETVDPLYKKGFEHGYWLEQGGKSFDKEVKSAPINQSYLSGLLAGQKEAMREKVREDFKQIDELNKDSDKQKDIDL